MPVALKEWGENASDNPASLIRRLNILAGSIRVAGGSRAIASYLAQSDRVVRVADFQEPISPNTGQDPPGSFQPPFPQLRTRGFDNQR